MNIINIKTIAILMAIIFITSCSDKVSETLTYEVKEGEVICTFSKKDIQNFRSEKVDIEDFKSIAIKKFKTIDSLGIVDSKGWKLVQIDSNTFQLRKSLAAMEAMRYEQKMLLMQHLTPGFDRRISGMQDFGHMPYPVTHITEVQKNTYRFYLAGHQDADLVHLSGNFNQWSALATPMIKTGSGWTCDLPLKPGAYLYKFVVDGQWTKDPINPNTKPNEFGGANSKFVISNYQFKLNQKLDAKEVFLAGDFTNWQADKIRMTNKVTHWIADIYLKDGTYQYKYIVDGQWITDPNNPDRVETSDGIFNSQIRLGTPHHFELDGYDQAAKVILSGSFNGWDETRTQMQYTHGKWQYRYVLPTGNHEYKFIVDGQWITDPANPLTVSNEHGTDNSWLVIGEPTVFELDGFPSAEVFLTGSFVGWDDGKCKMVRQDDRWAFPVYLDIGKHSYKFIVDGLWMPDPKNDYKEMGHKKSFNSVLWIGADGN